MDGHDDIAQFGPADDPITIGVVQRENPVIKNKMTDKRERIVRLDNESGHSLAGAVMLCNCRGLFVFTSAICPAQIRETGKKRPAPNPVDSIQKEKEQKKKDYYFCPISRHFDDPIKI